MGFFKRRKDAVSNGGAKEDVQTPAQTPTPVAEFTQPTQQTASPPAANQPLPSPAPVMPTMPTNIIEPQPQPTPVEPIMPTETPKVQITPTEPTDVTQPPITPPVPQNPTSNPGN